MFVHTSGPLVTSFGQRPNGNSPVEPVQSFTIAALSLLFALVMAGWAFAASGQGPVTLPFCTPSSQFSRIFAIACVSFDDCLSNVCLHFRLAWAGPADTTSAAPAMAMPSIFETRLFIVFSLRFWVELRDHRFPRRLMNLNWPSMSAIEPSTSSPSRPLSSSSLRLTVLYAVYQAYSWRPFKYFTSLTLYVWPP